MYERRRNHVNHTYGNQNAGSGAGAASSGGPIDSDYLMIIQNKQQEQYAGKKTVQAKPHSYEFLK